MTHSRPHSIQWQSQDQKQVSQPSLIRTLEFFMITLVWHTAEDMGLECDVCQQIMKNIKENGSRRTLIRWLPYMLNYYAT